VIGLAEHLLSPTTSRRPRAGTGSREALVALIREIKTGKADHLL
jgi:hypothetical protein